MADSQETTKRYMRIMNDLVQTNTFTRDVELVRGGRLELWGLLSRHNIPPRLIGCVLHYVESDELDENCIEPPARIISDYEKASSAPKRDLAVLLGRRKDPGQIPFFEHDVYIKLTPDLSQPELIEFIKDNWSEIERDLKAVSLPWRERRPGGPIRSAPSIKTHQAIMKLYDAGVRPRDIAKQLNLDAPYISRVVYREKEKRKSRS